MTRFQKIAVTAGLAALAVATLTALHQTREARAARAEAKHLWDRQAQFNQQIADLHSNIADLTNQLASLLAENSRLKNHSDEMELLKLRGEVTRLRPLQDDVVALQKKLKESAPNLTEWKTNDLADVGRATPEDALRTFLFLSKFSDPAKLQNSLVGDDADPPDPDALQNFIKSESSHPEAGDGAVNYKILSQTPLGSDKVEVELNVTFGDSRMGVSAPITLRNINNEWKVVVFNIRDQNGKLNHLGFVGGSPTP